VLGTETGAEVVLGRAEQPGIEAIQTMADLEESPFAALLRSAGAPDVAEQWNRFRERSEEPQDMAGWQPPDRWLEGDTTVEVGARTLDAVLTPGHTPGHYVFADRAASLLFAGDHVLPTITPSIGFTHPPAPSPLSDFMASLTKVRGLPDLQLLPAHGPVAPSSHARVDALLAHHEERLAACLRALEAGAHTSAEVAGQLPWTRHEHAFASLDVFNQGLAALETKAHLEVLVARGQATRDVAADPDAVVSFGVPTA
jgi:glyoxylase-like metal-dependent hydrolase (beta-lactamase superfamily II)